MNRVLLIFLFFLVGVFPVKAAETNRTVKVLFVGNSLTSAGNLPQMAADIAKTKGYSVFFDSYTKGAARLKNHAADDDLRKKLESNYWDFVVLQEQSQYPAFSKYQIAKDVFPYAKSLNREIRKINSGTKVIFYMTMARKNGDPGNKNVSPELLTYEGMQKRINRTYLEMAKRNSAMVAPVGEIWQKFRKENPDINLYADNVHPNRLGTYLTACVFYCVLFECLVKDLNPPPGLKPQDAVLVQKIVDRVMCKGNGQWDFTDH